MVRTGTLPASQGYPEKGGMLSSETLDHVSETSQDRGQCQEECLSFPLEGAVFFGGRGPRQAPSRVLGGLWDPELSVLIFWCFSSCCGWCPKRLPSSSAQLCPEVIWARAAEKFERMKVDVWGTVLKSSNSNASVIIVNYKFKLKVILSLLILVSFLFGREDGG